MVDGVHSNDSNMQLQATTQFRKLLSIEGSPQIEEVIQSGVVPCVVKFLTREDFPQLQYEAAWVLTNIADGASENRKVVIDNGAIPIFVKLLSSPIDDMCELAAWALGNIACDSTWCRDAVLGQGALIPLMAMLKAHDKLSMVRRATWTLTKFCGGEPQPPFEQTRMALAALVDLVHSRDTQVLADACWALSYLSNGTNDQIQAVIDAGFVPRLVKLLLCRFSKIAIPAIRTVGNIVRGDDNHKECIIMHGALPCLFRLLTYPQEKSVKKEACWTISKITAGNIKQKQALIDARLTSALVFLLERAEFDIKKEATWAISNVTCGASNEQIKHLVSERCIKPLCDILLSPDPEIVTVSLGVLENILKAGEVEKNTGNTGDVNSYAQLIDDARGLENIKYLNGHDNNDISNKAHNIMETYWSGYTHVDAEKGKRQREDNMVKIHTNKREKDTSIVKKLLESLPCMADGVHSNDNNMQLQATTQFRKLLSIGPKPRIEEVIQSGVVPRLVEFLTREDFPQLQYEAAWALTNIANGACENRKVVIDNGAVPIFVKFLASPSDDMCKMAACALGNISYGSIWCRDAVLGQGALIPLVALLKDQDKLSMVRRVTEALKKLCMGKPHPPFEQTRIALAALADLVHSSDEQVLKEACWALFHLSNGTHDQIQAVIEAGFVPHLVKLLRCVFPKVAIPAILAVGNIVRGDDNHKECIIEHGALPCLLRLLTLPFKYGGKMEACWTISNLTAGNIKQKQAVIDAGLIPPLVFLLESGKFDIKKQATWAISNLTCGCSNEQIKHLVSERCIEPLCDILLCPDPNIVIASLVGLENILKVGEVEKNMGDVNSYAQLIDDTQGLQNIKYLRGHDNNDVSNKARDLIEKYWFAHKYEPVVRPDNYSELDAFFRWR